MLCHWSCGGSYVLRPIIPDAPAAATSAGCAASVLYMKPDYVADFFRAIGRYGDRVIQIRVDPKAHAAILEETGKNEIMLPCGTTLRMTSAA